MSATRAELHLTYKFNYRIRNIHLPNLNIISLYVMLKIQNAEIILFDNEYGRLIHSIKATINHIIFILCCRPNSRMAVIEIIERIMFPLTGVTQYKNERCNKKYMI